ncbi:hypothetical protein HYX13_05650 [Candidatus Woesearchaeota archaeon]|nr:hypothetical protein [Candidatus Woesearchaeota archaeon]
MQEEHHQQARESADSLVAYQQPPPGPPPELKQISEVVWELPMSFKKGMLVPARIIATKELIDGMDAGVFNQISNVATLPGI